MNIIAGLLRGLAPLPPPDQRGQDEANGEAQSGTGNAFGNVLSELLQNSAAGAEGTNSVPPQKPVNIRINPDEAQSESPEGSASGGPPNATTVAQTLAALGDLAALAEQNAANAANGNGKPGNGAANGGSNTQQQKGSPIDFVSTGEGGSQQPGPGGPTLASELGAVRQALANGAAGALGANTAAQSSNPTSLRAFNKAGVVPAPDNQPSDGTENAGGGTQPFNPGISSLLTRSLAAQFDQDAPPNGSNQPPGPKDANANQPNAGTSANAATLAFAANAAAMAAAFQPTGPSVPTSGGPSGPRPDADKAGLKTRPLSPSADSNGNTSTNQATQPSNLDGVIAGNMSAFIPPPVPAGQAGPPMPGGSSAFAGAANRASTLPPLFQTTAAAADPDPSASIKLTVLSTTTHFAPPAQLSPVHQIATAIEGAVPGLSLVSSGTFAASSAAGDDGTSTGGLPNGGSDPTNVALPGPAKVLNLQLEPSDLGTVTISLNLSNGALDVQLAASQPATANLIERDKNALGDQLRDSGYSVASVGVSLDPSGSNVANDGSATQGQANQAFSQNNGQDTSQGGTFNGNGSTGQDGPDRSLPDSLAPMPDSLAGGGTGGPVSGELYI
jgi:chemotaxis protein MotD